MTDRRTLILDADLTQAMAGLQKLDTSVDKSAHNAARLAKAISKSDDNTKKLTESTNKLQRAIELAQGGVSGIAKAVIPLPGAFMAVAAAAGAAAGAIKLVNDETARLDQLAKDAQRSGLGVEGYQRLSFVAEQSSSNIETLSKAVRNLNLQLDAVARTGSGPTAEALEELGLKVADLRGRDATEQLAIVADAISGVSNEYDRTRIAMKLAGEEAVRLIPLFNEGGDAVRRMAEDSGHIFTREQLAAAEDYQTALGNLGKAIADIRGEIAVSLAPLLTEIADDFTAGANGARELADPAIRLAVDRLTATIKPLVEVAAFFARQWAVVGEAIETAENLMGAATSAAKDLAGSLRDWVRDTAVAEWARESTSGVREFADDGLARLDKAIEDHLPRVDKLRKRWAGVRDVIAETRTLAESPEIKAAFEEIAKIREDTQRRLREQQDKIVESQTEQVEKLKEAAIQAEHQARLGEAQGKTARELEVLYRQQYQAKLDLLQATNKIAEAEQLQRDEEIRRARAAAAARRRGGARSTEAEILRAEGEKILTEWQQRLALMEGEASLLFEKSVEFGEIRHRLAIEELRLEQQVLESTKTRTEAERIANATRREAIEREIQILELGEQRRLQVEATDRERTSAAERIAALDREIERNEALGVSVRLLQEQRDAAAIDFAARFEGEEALRQEQHAQEMARIEESQARWRAWNENRKKQHEAELKRLEEQAKKQQATINSVNSALGQGQAFASTIVDHAIKDDARREKAALRLNGVMALARGALEVVEAAAAFARYDFVGGALHSAASIVAFTQGGLMLAGQVPGGQSGAAPPAAGGGFQATTGPSSQQAANETPSTPASAEAITRIRGGYSSGSTSSPSSSGGAPVQINAGVIVTNDSAYQLDRVAEGDQRKWGGDR